MEPCRKKKPPVVMKVRVLTTGKKENEYVQGNVKQQQRLDRALCNWKEQVLTVQNIQQSSFLDRYPLSGVLKIRNGISFVFLNQLNTKKVETIGYKVDEDDKNLGILCLDWEEVLFLIDQQALKVYYSLDDKESIHPKELYILCIPKTKSLYSITHWLCFNMLKRLGYIPRRIKHSINNVIENIDENIEDNENQIQCREWWPQYSPPKGLPKVTVIKRYSPFSFYGNKYESNNNCSIGMYNVYKPRKSFSKRNPGNPETRMACINAEEWTSNSFLDILQSQNENENTTLNPLVIACTDRSFHYSFFSISEPNTKHLLQNNFRQKNKK